MTKNWEKIFLFVIPQPLTFPCRSIIHTFYLGYKEDMMLLNCLKTCDDTYFPGKKFRLFSVITEVLHSLPQSTLQLPTGLQPQYVGAPAKLWFPKHWCFFFSSVQNSVVCCLPSHLVANGRKARIKSWRHRYSLRKLAELLENNRCSNSRKCKSSFQIKERNWNKTINVLSTSHIFPFLHPNFHSE